MCRADDDGDGDFVDDASEAGFALFEFDFCEFAVGDIEADACEFEEFAVGASTCDGDGADVAEAWDGAGSGGWGGELSEAGADVDAGGLDEIGSGET